MLADTDSVDPGKKINKTKKLMTLKTKLMTLKNVIKTCGVWTPEKITRE
jgi:hypothetical protein